jgi:hypothetical protein
MVCSNTALWLASAIARWNRASAAPPPPGHFIDPVIAILQGIERRLQPLTIRPGGTLRSVIGA